MTLVAQVRPQTTGQSICRSQPRSCPDNARLPCVAPIKTHAIIWQPRETTGDTQNTQEREGGWHRERRKMWKDRKAIAGCYYWRAKVIKWCVVYFDHPLGLCLVFCIVFIAGTLLTAPLPLSSALKQNPFSGVESSPQSLVQCRPVLWWSEGIGTLSLTHLRRRESEAWQSPALSGRSNPLSFKLLQMFGERGHSAGPGWLTQMLNFAFQQHLDKSLQSVDAPCISAELAQT